MMKTHLKAFVRATVVAALILFPFQAASAGTILKLSLGTVGPDLEYSGGVLSTSDDGIAGTPGEQNTAVDFLDFLSGMTDITLPDASYTLNGVTATGPANIFGTVVLQFFTGGNFQLFDDSNALLLDVNLGDTALSGPLGPVATGAVFSIANGAVVGGSLAPLIIDSSISIAIAMTDVESAGGVDGLTITPLPRPVFGLGTLNDFTADATKAIAGDPVPEPAAAVLVILGSLLTPVMMRRRG